MGYIEPRVNPIMETENSMIQNEMRRHAIFAGHWYVNKRTPVGPLGPLPKFYLSA